MTGPGATKTAASLMGSAVSGSHVTPGSSAVRELSLPRPQSESVFVFVCLRRSARWLLVQKASGVGPLFYIEGLETDVACVF